MFRNIRGGTDSEGSMQDDHSQPPRKSSQRLALMLGLIAAAFYVGFILLMYSRSH